MKRFLLAFLAFLVIHAHAEERRTKIVIVDTGLDMADPRFKDVVCESGHWNFATNDTSDLADKHGHGTHIAGLIKHYAGKGNYCFIILKVFDGSSPRVQHERTVRAFIRAGEIGAHYVNYSGGGNEDENNILTLAERLAILVAQNTTFIVAAGNQGRDVSHPGREFYPAAHNLPNIIPVGGLDSKCRYKYAYSNHGSKVKAWELGDSVFSTMPSSYGHLSGTSMATAVHTGKVIAGKAGQSCVPAIQHKKELLKTFEPAIQRQ